MGITQSAVEEGILSRDRSRAASPQVAAAVASHKDALWTIDQNEVVRLCRVYDEEIGIMYPILDLDQILSHVKMLYSFISAALRPGFNHANLLGADALDDEETTILKMVLAVTLIVESGGKSEAAQRFFDSARSAVDLKIVGPSDLKSVILLVLTATYYFHKDEEAQAWRFIGIAARICIELGLHRKDSLVKTFTNEVEYRDAIRIFWTVYALDRRWSFGTGMPFALQDSDIDPNLPEPDDSKPYLKHITKYNHIATKVWYYNISYETGQGGKRDEARFLDFQIQDWYDQLPETLKFNSKDLKTECDIQGRGNRRLRLLMHLRKNQARISIYRPILHSATSIMENRVLAQSVIDTAKDTISTLTGINQMSDIYRSQQALFNYFLIQALAVIFLSVAHAPALFCSQTRPEFYAAIDLVKGFSTKSYISKRLWKTIRGLKEMGDKIGILARGGNPMTHPDHNAQSDAAVAMAGLAGHKVDYSGYGGQRNASMEQLGYSPDDAQQMTIELSSFFELAGNYSGFHNGTPNGAGFTGYSDLIGEGNSIAFGNEPEFSKILNELF